MQDGQKQKFGQGHASAMIRQGGKELAQVLPAFPAGGSVQPVEEPGLVGNLTPQEVVRDKGGQQSYQAALDGYTARGRTATPQQALQQSAER